MNYNEGHMDEDYQIMDAETSTDLSKIDPEYYKICEVSFEDFARDLKCTADQLRTLRIAYDEKNVRVICAYYNSILANPKLPLRFLKEWINNAKSHGVVNDKLQQIESEISVLQKKELIAVLEAWKESDPDGTNFGGILSQMCADAIKNGMPENTVQEIKNIFSDSEVTIAKVQGVVKAKIDFPVPDTVPPENRNRAKHPPVERITEEKMKKMWKKRGQATKASKPHGDLSAD